MTRRQRSELVAVRAELHRGQVRGLLYVSYVHFARAGAILFGLDTREIQ